MAQEPAKLTRLWPIIEALKNRNGVPGTAEAYRRRLVATISALDAVDLARFIDALAEAMVELRSRRHWAAASLRLGRLADHAEFEQLRAWVIAHGASAWQAVRADPEGLLDVSPDQTAILLAPLLETPRKHLQSRIARDAELEHRIGQALAGEDSAPDENHIGWEYWERPSAEELRRCFPRLYARYGHAWRDVEAAEDVEPGDLDGFVRETVIPGLGTVRIGDRLVRRHDRSSFEVLGLHDLRALLQRFAPPASGMPAEEEALSSFMIARVRDEDGTIGCNQVLEHRFVGRPDDPSVLDPPPSVQEWSGSVCEQDADAYEAADDALQARVRAALADAEEVRVRYAAAPEDAQGLPIDNLDEIAHHGPVQFVEVDDRDGERFESEVLTDPTWLDLCRVANQMMLKLGYLDHVYLEGITVRRRRGKPARAEFLLGS